MQFTTKFALILIMLFSFGCSSQSSVDVPEISQTELLELTKSDPSLLILDVRSPQEYAQGRVPQAKLIPHTELQSRLAEISDAKNSPVVVYCKSGYRAGIAESILIEAGFSNVMHLAGDMSGWISAKQPIER